MNAAEFQHWSFYLLTWRTAPNQGHIYKLVLAYIIILEHSKEFKWLPRKLGLFKETK